MGNTQPVKSLFVCAETASNSTLNTTDSKVDRFGVLPKRTPPRFDTTTLRRLMRRAERTEKLIAFGLVLLPVGFLFFSIVVPISTILWSSIHSPTLTRELPNLVRAMRGWDGLGKPPPSVVRAFVGDMLASVQRHRIGRIAFRLNQQVPGFRSFLYETAQALRKEADKVGRNRLLERPDLLAWMTGLDRRWGERKYWVGLHQAAPEYTLVYLLRTIDLKYDLDGNIVRVPAERALYVDVIGRTILTCSIVTLVCLLLGFPIAYLLARLPMETSNLLMLLLLLPLWTSMLVKTMSWLVVLGGEGVINDLGRGLGLWNESIQLSRNRIGALISMVHILVPFMTFPIYAVMRNIDEYHMKAAAIMGANPLRAFLRVFLPQTIPGVGAGVFLVLILSLGLYVPPALVGGPRDQMLGYFIAYNVNGGLSGALAVVLLLLVAVFMVAYQRVVGAGNIWFKASV